MDVVVAEQHEHHADDHRQGEDRGCQDDALLGVQAALVFGLGVGFIVSAFGFDDQSIAGPAQPLLQALGRDVAGE